MVPKRKESCPAGIGRDCVRGFILSMSWSTMRLKVMAAVRALIMQSIISSNCLPLGWPFVAKKRLVSANGSAKTECLNLIMSRVRASLREKVVSIKLKSLLVSNESSSEPLNLNDLGLAPPRCKSCLQAFFDRYRKRAWLVKSWCLLRQASRGYAVE